MNSSKTFMLAVGMLSTYLWNNEESNRQNKESDKDYSNNSTKTKDEAQEDGEAPKY